MTPSLIKKVAGKFLSTDLCERFTAQAGLQHQFKPLLTTRNFGSLTDFWDDCIKSVGRDKSVLFLEFGVWEGASIKYFAARFPNAGSRFIGCDSFEGLPDRWGILQEKTFSTNGKMPVIDDPRVTFVKGWFQNTIGRAIELARKENPKPDEVFIHFDADLYSSTLFLLSRLQDQFDHYYFIFDQFVGHESRALLNFQQAYGVSIEFFSHIGGEIPGQVFGRLDNRRGKYEPGAGRISGDPNATHD